MSPLLQIAGQVLAGSVAAGFGMGEVSLPWFMLFWTLGMITNWVGVKTQ